MSLVSTLLGLLLYGVLLLLAGGSASRRMARGDFFTAGRRSAWYEVWPAMIAAAMSGITFVSVPGSVAEDGMTYLQMVAGFTVGQLLIACWLVPLFYRMRLTSLYEYFAHRFGSATHRTCGWLFLLSKLASASLKLSVVALVLQQLLFAPLGIPLWINVALIVGLSWGYTRKGGVGAVIRADWLKTAAMTGALVATMWAVLSALDWSVGEAWQEVMHSPMARVWCFDDPSSDRYFWKMFGAGVLLLLAMTGLDQELMQRNLACRSVADAQKNIVLTAVSQAVVIFAFLFLGVLLYRYAAAVQLTLPEKSDQFFAAVSVNSGLQWWVGVLFVVGFAAGSFSAGGAALTALTTSVMVDVINDNWKKNKDLTNLKNQIHFGLAVAMAVIVLCFGYGADESIINLIYRVAGYTYGPILGLFLFGQWTRWQVRDRLVWAVALAAPILSAVLQYVSTVYLNYFIGFELLLFNATFTFIGLWLIRRRDTNA